MSYTDTEEKRKSIQRALTDAGFPLGIIDGDLGSKSAASIVAYRTKKKLEPYTATVDLKLMQSLFPTASPKGNNMTNWLTTFVGTTAFKYLVAMVATFIATKLGLDKGSIEGLLTQLVGIAMGVWGMWEASRQKIVINGDKVAVSELTQTDKATVQAIVNKTASK